MTLLLAMNLGFAWGTGELPPVPGEIRGCRLSVVQNVVVRLEAQESLAARIACDLTMGVITRADDSLMVRISIMPSIQARLGVE